MELKKSLTSAYKLIPKTESKSNQQKTFSKNYSKKTNIFFNTIRKFE